MARSEIPMVINLRQNKNDDSTAYGKYFAEVDSKEPLNLKGFAAHMTSHGKQKRFQKKTPLSYVLAPAADQQGNG